jgi:hypothetical protein
MPNLANLANKNRLHTGWETSRDKGSEIKAPAHYIMMNSGLKDTLQYSEMKMLSPDVIVDSKHGHSPKGSSLTHKLRQTREKAMRFQLAHSGADPLPVKMATPIFNNRILRMFDPSYLTMTGDIDQISQQEFKSSTF